MVIPYKLKLWFKRSILPYIPYIGKNARRPSQPPSERLSAYSLDESAPRDRIDPKRRMADTNPYLATQQTNGVYIPGISPKPVLEEDEELQSQTQPANPVTPHPPDDHPTFISELKEIAAGDIDSFIDWVYHHTRSGGKLHAQKKSDAKAKREQFERLARGER